MGQEKPLGPQESEVVAEQTRVSGCLVHLTRDTSGPETQLSCPQHSGWWLLKEVASAMTVTTAMTTMRFLPNAFTPVSNTAGCNGKCQTR